MATREQERPDGEYRDALGQDRVTIPARTPRAVMRTSRTPRTPRGVKWMPRAAGRVRRPADLLFAVGSLAVVVTVLGTIRTLPLGCTELADDVSHWLAHIPRWLSSAAAVIAGTGCFVLAVVALVIMVRSRWRDARNAIVAAIAAAAAAIAASAVWHVQHGAIF